jgi:hypothetical protein
LLKKSYIEVLKLVEMSYFRVKGSRGTYEELKTAEMS